MKKAKLKIIIPVLIVVLALILVLFITRDNVTTYNSSEDDNSITYTKLTEITDDVNTIYDLQYQGKIKSQINRLIKKHNYTFDNPLLIVNPFGTNTTGIYMYFTTDIACKADYSIETSGYNSFSESLNNDEQDGYTTVHEYLLVGSVPGTTNIITVNLYDETDNLVDSLCWSYDATNLAGSEDNIQLEVTNGESNEPLSDGFYTMLGNRTAEDNEEIDFILIYDNDGTIRSEIPIISYRSCRILFEDDIMYFSTSASLIAAMDRTGQITNLYNTGDYKLHHDYIFRAQNDFLVLASQKNSDTQEDLIISIDATTGDINKLVDLKDLFSNYYKNLTNDGDEALDWMHINSIDLIDDNSIIISSRETSTIIRISNLYQEPTIDYLIGSKQFWQESGYDDLVLDASGNFSLNAGQHCVIYQADDSLPAGQYYLYFYNNNNTYCSSRDYDYSLDDSYYGTGIGTNGEYSYYEKYLVDENNRTFSLVKQIPVTYSGYVSSVQELDNNTLVDSGSAFEAFEFDNNDQLIQSLKGSGATWWYRVFKYDYKNYWFN